MASLPRIGETISGFTVTELGTIHMPVSYTHLIPVIGKY